jgi:hypothetical protein
LTVERGGSLEMDEERRRLLVAGVALGDIALARAALADELPAYVPDDTDDLTSGMEDLPEVSRQVEEHLTGEPDTFPEGLLRLILGRALARGKYLSAGRCLDLLGGKETWIEEHTARALEAARGGDPAGAARMMVEASNLALDDGIPMFQYTGPALHENCVSRPEACITRMPLENALPAAVKHLLGSESVFGAVKDLSVDTLKTLLPHLARQRDPHLEDLRRGLDRAREELRAAASDLEGGLAETLKSAGSEVRQLAGALRAAKSVTPADALERARRLVGSLAKDFEGMDDLIKSRQLRRLRHRAERLVEAGEELGPLVRELEGEGTGEDLGRLMDLAREFENQEVPRKLEDIENRIIASQAQMLGRSAHSQEHWQFLRELAFKYPAGPLVVCLARINDRWMVVGSEGELSTLLLSNSTG